MPRFFINIKEFTSEDTNICLSLLRMFWMFNQCFELWPINTPGVDASNIKMHTIDKCRSNFTTNIIFCILNINDICF